MVVITNHARDRMKERCGFNKKTQDRMVDKVLKEGIPHSKVKGNLRKWVDGLYLEYRNGNNIRLYGDVAYIFKNETLITVFIIPNNLRRDMQKYIKK